MDMVLKNIKKCLPVNLRFLRKLLKNYTVYTLRVNIKKQSLFLNFISHIIFNKIILKSSKLESESKSSFPLLNILIKFYYIISNNI